MGMVKHLCLSLALGVSCGVLAAAQAGHGGGGHSYGVGNHPVGSIHEYAPGAGFGHGFNSLGATPNAVSGQVGVGAGHNYYGPNGFHNPRPVPGPGTYRSGQYYGDSRRRGAGVGVIPFFPFGGYLGYDGGYGAYDDNGPYAPPVDEEQQPGPYDQGPYMEQQPYPQAGGPPMMGFPPQGGYEAPPAIGPDARTPVASMPPVTVVLRTGQQLQVVNFAVANGFFWDFSKPAPHKIPIANIDVAASEKATEASGGEFPNLSGDSTPSPAN